MMGGSVWEYLPHAVAVGLTAIFLLDRLWRLLRRIIPRRSRFQSRAARQAASKRRVTFKPSE